MAVARGSSSALRWKEETTYGTAATGNYNEFSFSSEGLGENINNITSDEIRSDRTVPSVRGGNIGNQGNIVTDFSLNRFPKWFQHLLGGVVATTTITPTALANNGVYLRGDIVSNGASKYLVSKGGTASATAVTTITGTAANVEVESGTATFVYAGPTATPIYRHVITGSPAFPVPGISIEKGVLGGDENAYWLFTGGRIGSLAVTIPQEGIVKSTWDFTFVKKPTYGTTTSAGTPVVVTDEPVVGFDAQIEFVGQGGVAGDIREASFTINNNLETDDFRIGSRFRATTNARRREGSGSITAMFENKSKYDLFRNEQKFGLLFTFRALDAFLSVEFAECKIFGDPTPKIGGAGNVTLPFSFTAFRQASAYDIQVVLKNGTAAYA